MAHFDVLSESGLHFVNFVSSVVQVCAASKELRADRFISGEKGGFSFFVIQFCMVDCCAVTPRTGCSPVDVGTEALYYSFTDSDHTSPHTDSIFLSH